VDNNISQTGLLIIVSGPAGCGKTTLGERMLAEVPELWRVVTSTTRKPRTGEKDHVDYYFFDHATFEEKIKTGHFYEYAHVHGNIYGTLKSEVQDKLAIGTDLLLNTDVQGAASLRKTAQTDELLKGHVITDDEDEINRRMRVALDEMKQSDQYDHTILSASRGEDFEALQAIYRAEKAKLA
jgi:guanylate kinase